MKKIIFLLLLMLIPLITFADKSGTCGENLKWTYIKSTLTLTISGNGEMKNYEWKKLAPWNKLKILNVVIENGVTSIGNCAFYSSAFLASITIPSSVTSIGDDAFHFCYDLTSVTIPNSVKSIGYGAFSNCGGLKSVNIPNSVTEIKDCAFSDCSSLTSVTISNSLTSTGSSTFQNCYNLKSIEIPNGVKWINSYTFEDCYRLTSITIPNSVKRISGNAFKGCSALASVTIPNSVEYISKDAFPSTTRIIREEAIEMTSAPSLNNKQPLNANQIPNLVVVPNSIVFTDRAGANAIVGGKNSTITLKVQNTGKGTAYNCQAKISSTGSILGITANNVTLGSISAGETKTIEIPIIAGMNTQDGQVEFTIQVDEPNGFGTDPHYLTVQTKAFEAPMVKITDYSLTGNAGTTLKKKQPFDLQLMLQNTKYGHAEDISVSIEVPQNVIVFDGSQQQNFANLNGGETKSLVYSLIVNNNYQGSTIPINVHVKEKYGKYAEDRTINLTLDQALASTKIDVKASQTQPRSDIHIATIGSDVDKELPQTTVEQQNTFVVIIANEHYQTVDGVPFANNDGAMFEAYCRQTLGIPQDNIRMVKDATLNGMRHQIDWLRKVMETFNGRASAIVYYAGHGIPDEQSHASFLLPTDGYPTNMKSAYSLDELYQTLGNMPAHSVTVFLDACFSGSKRGEGMIASARGVEIKARNSTPRGNMVVFSAAQGNETAYPYNEQEHGMFTYYLLKKLKETKGEATLGDLADYITQSVKEKSIVVNSKSQTPSVSASPALTDSWKDMKLK